MTDRRIDPDYDPSQDDEDLRRLVRLAVRAGAQVSNTYSEGGNGEKKMLSWILGVLSLLVVGAVGGGISLYGKVSSLETRVTEWQRASDRRMDVTDARLDRLENR
jgi:hypothetical protein